MILKNNYAYILQGPNTYFLFFAMDKIKFHILDQPNVENDLGAWQCGVRAMTEANINPCHPN